MLPAHLIVEFWDTVCRELRTRHDLTEDDANTAIARYRAALDRHQVGDLIYHRDPESVTETVAGGWRSGFPDPVIDAQSPTSPQQP
ncbi:MAG TPA: hypothetical protein VFG68_17480 [Fimbriiglobus sp.]|nr:hypothetical protein [Fimbriiglobus sp.]